MFVTLAVAILLIVVATRAICLGVVEVGFGVKRLTGKRARVVGGVAVLLAILLVSPAIGWFLVALLGGG